MSKVLCLLKYKLPQQQSDTENTESETETQKHVQVISGMSTYQLSQIIGKELGCGYLTDIEEEIKSQLQSIVEQDKRNQEKWKQEMERIIYGHQKTQREESKIGKTQTLHNTSAYFKNSFQKVWKNKQEKNQTKEENKENQMGIYERCVLQKKKTQQKLLGIKRNKINEQLSQCTFTPNVGDTFKFWNKKNPKFFQNQNQSKLYDNTFQKLYKQSFDLKQKRKHKLRTLQNEQQEKISELSFIPEINSCSREICKMKSYASFISEMSDIDESEQLKPKNKTYVNKTNENTIKKSKFQTYTFKPELSENTKKLTENLPSFYERLQLSKSKQKKQMNNSTSKCSIKKSNSTYNFAKQKPKQQTNKSKIKKQYYTIDDLNLSPNKKQNCQRQIINISYENSLQKPTQSTTKISHLSKVQQQKRSQELFTNRKKLIFQIIFSFLTLKPPQSIAQFSILSPQYRPSLSSATEVSMQDISQHPYLPQFLKQLFSPIAEELGELQISLNRQEFIWAIQKLFGGLDLSDRGTLLGWGVKLLPEI